MMTSTTTIDMDTGGGAAAREPSSGTSKLYSSSERWARRFMAAAIIQGAIVVGLTVFLVLGQISILKPEVSRVIASGGAGTWFTFGYLYYILVGVIGVAVSSVFYHYLAGASFTRARNALAWAHLLLMNIGTSAAAGMMMYAGYQGGAAMLPTAIGGRDFDAQQAHSIMAPFVEPIAVSILVILAGVVLGGVVFLLGYRVQQQTWSNVESSNVKK